MRDRELGKKKRMTLRKSRGNNVITTSSNRSVGMRELEWD